MNDCKLLLKINYLLLAKLTSLDGMLTNYIIWLADVVVAEELFTIVEDILLVVGYNGLLGRHVDQLHLRQDLPECLALIKES